MAKFMNTSIRFMEAMGNQIKASGIAGVVSAKHHVGDPVRDLR